MEKKCTVGYIQGLVKIIFGIADDSDKKEIDRNGGIGYFVTAEAPLKMVDLKISEHHTVIIRELI